MRDAEAGSMAVVLMLQHAFTALRGSPMLYTAREGLARERASPANPIVLLRVTYLGSRCGKVHGRGVVRDQLFSTLGIVSWNRRRCLGSSVSRKSR